MPEKQTKSLHKNEQVAVTRNLANSQTTIFTKN